MKYLIFIALIALSAVFSASIVRAQTVAPWTLEQCVRYSIENSPETNIQQNYNTIAKQDYIEAIGRVLPSVGAAAGASFSFGRSLGDDNTYVDANSLNNSYQISAGLTLFDGMRNINAVRLQKFNRATGRHLLDRKRDEVAYATMQAFFNVAYCKDISLLAESQLEESRLNLRQAERMEELGLKGFPDVAEMRAQEAADSYNLTRNRNLLAIGIILLKERMNFPVDEELEIVPYEYTGDIESSPETASELYARALEHLPRVQAARSSLKASEVAYQHAKGALFPTLSVNGGYSTGFFRNLDDNNYIPFRDQISGKRNYYVGATVSIPIFNGFSAASGARRGKQQLAIARIENDAELRALYTEIEQALADMNGQAMQHTQAMRQREAAAVAHDVNRRKYEEGLSSALELYTSSNRLAQARAEELNSRLTYILKKRMVDYYSGIPLID